MTMKKTENKENSTFTLPKDLSFHTWTLCADCRYAEWDEDWDGWWCSKNGTHYPKGDGCSLAD